MLLLKEKNAALAVDYAAEKKTADACAEAEKYVGALENSTVREELWQELLEVSAFQTSEQLRQELLCTGIFQGKRRKELQGQIGGKEQQIADVKQRMRNIVRGYSYSGVNDLGNHKR